jgi:DNA-binding transcriptional ArsR family regulator
MNTSAANSGSLPSQDADVLLPESLAVELAELFRALADPTRARMVYALTQQDMTTTGLAMLLGVNAPAISQHLRLLRTLRLVKPRREGQLVYYSLDDDHIRLLVTLSLTHLREAGGTPPIG